MSYLYLDTEEMGEVGAPAVVDPDAVNRAFDEIARLVNGALGAENVRGGRGFTLGMMERQRSFQLLTFQLDTVNPVAWPAGGVLCSLKQAGWLFGAAVTGASVATPFQATLDVNGVIRMGLTCLETPPASSYWRVDPTSGSLLANDQLQLNVGAGSLSGSLTLLVSLAHVA